MSAISFKSPFPPCLNSPIVDIIGEFLRPGDPVVRGCPKLQPLVVKQLKTDLTDEIKRIFETIVSVFPHSQEAVRETNEKVNQLIPNITFANHTASLLEIQQSVVSMQMNSNEAALFAPEIPRDLYYVPLKRFLDLRGVWDEDQLSSNAILLIKENNLAAAFIIAERISDEEKKYNTQKAIITACLQQRPPDFDTALKFVDKSTLVEHFRSSLRSDIISACLNQNPPEIDLALVAARGITNNEPLQSSLLRDIIDACLKQNLPKIDLALVAAREIDCSYTRSQVQKDIVLTCLWQSPPKIDLAQEVADEIVDEKKRVAAQYEVAIAKNAVTFDIEEAKEAVKALNEDPHAQSELQRTIIFACLWQNPPNINEAIETAGAIRIQEDKINVMYPIIGRYCLGKNPPDFALARKAADLTNDKEFRSAAKQEIAAAILRYLVAEIIARF